MKYKIKRNKMKTYFKLIVTAFLLGAMPSYSQDATAVKNAYKNFDSFKKLEDSLKKSCEEIKEVEKIQADSIKKVEQRNAFKPSNNEASIKNYVLSFKTTEDFRDSLIREKLKNRLSHCTNIKWTKTYMNLLDIIETLYAKNYGYEKSRNDSQKEMLKNMSLFPEHEALKNEILNKIKDYRFIMFELARVIKLSAKKYNTVEPASLYGVLQNSGETKYIDEIDYTKIILINYCKDTNKRKKILDELKNSCPEAFTN